jgi:hypothetical protein
MHSKQHTLASNKDLVNWPELAEKRSIGSIGSSSKALHDHKIIRRL